MSELLEQFFGLATEYVGLLTSGPAQGEEEAFNNRLGEITEAFNEIKAAPEFVFVVLENIDGFLENESVAKLVFTQIQQTIKNFWHNEEQILERPQIKNLILQCLFKCSENEVITNLILNSISIIASSDYPSQWTDFNEILTTSLTQALEEEEPNFFIVNAILCAASEVFKKFENSSRSDYLNSQPNVEVDYWGNTVMQLMNERLLDESFLGEELGVTVYTNLLKLYYTLLFTGGDLHENLIIGVKQVFVTLKQLMEIEGLYGIKSQICSITRQYVFRYLTDIFNWGKTVNEVEKREVSEEEMGEFVEIFFGLIDSIIQLFSDEELPISTANLAFTALKDVINSKDLREKYLTEERFAALWEAIQQALTLNETQLEEMEMNPVQYFNNDVGKIEECESTRKTAFDFMKRLTKYYREQINEMFSEIYDKTLPEQLAADGDKWVDYDRIVFFTGFVVAARTSYRDGVIEVIEGFDLVEFVQLFILPTLTPDFPYKILQADAVKFYVDYRNIIPAELTAECFQAFLNMMLSEHIATKLYGSYLVERLCNSRKLQIDAEFLASKDITQIITPLISSLVYDGEPVESLAATLKRIVVVGGAALAGQAVGIVKSLLTTISSGQRNPSNADFFHNIWETVAAAVVYTGVNIKELEEVMVTTFDEIIANNSVDFIPYAIQMYGAMIQSYPAEEEPNPVLIEHFVQFLDPEFWKPFGNIPALSMLITHFAHRLPAVVIENEGRILEICNELIGNSRTQMCAFQIFMGLITKEVSAETITAIIQIVLGHVEENIPMYKASLAIFFCNAAFILGADNFISALPAEVFEVWGNAIPTVRMRNDMENVVAGSLAVLESGAISQECWTHIFCGVVNLLERPCREDAQKEEREARRAEEEAATQFDTTFSRLVYAEKVTPLHPELKSEDMIRYFTVSIAEISTQKPGWIEAALSVEALVKPYIAQSFMKYQEKYEVQFN